MEGRGTYVWTWTFHQDPMKFDPNPHPKSQPFTQLVKSELNCLYSFVVNEVYIVHEGICSSLVSNWN